MLLDSDKARGRWAPAAAACRERLRYMAAVYPRPAGPPAWAREDLGDWCTRAPRPCETKRRGSRRFWERERGREDREGGRRSDEVRGGIEMRAVWISAYA
jgi:hypothetical protein